MALMMGSLYEALKEANVTDVRAKAAAEEVTSYERQLADLPRDMVERFGNAEATQRLHSWMLGVNSAMIVAILLRVFWP